VNRREFLASGLFGWFPFFRRNTIELAGMRFQIRRKGHSGRRYLHIHGNEDTARDVLDLNMKTHDGVAYLIEGRDRYVEIRGARIDPNRLFSRVGAEKSLRDQNRGMAPERIEQVLEFLDRHRPALVDHLRPGGGDLLFALHNNREYSVKEEVDQSDEVSLPQADHPREFFLCTDPRDFAILRQSPYNVVLQNRKPQVDDGSLSRLAAKSGFRYVNLECAIGEKAAQLERVAWVEDHLPHRLSR
jgi:hypothetical protein